MVTNANVRSVLVAVQCIFDKEWLSKMESALDLNLFVALDALLDEGSVSGAAQRLHTSAPAMSRTLARLRRMLDDPILVRAGRVMVPTRGRWR